MKIGITKNWWSIYESYVHDVILPNDVADANGLKHLRDRIFCSIMTYLTPFSLIALVPSIYMSFTNHVEVIGVADIFSFAALIFLVSYRDISLKLRKLIFMLIAYSISVLLLYYLSMPGPGLIFLLTITILSAIFYSSAAAKYSAWLNTLICLVFAVLLYFKLDMPIGNDYQVGSWIAVSSNLVLMSMVCAYGLSLLLQELEANIMERKISEANLSAIIENTDANIYSLDKEFRYIRFNKVLQQTIKAVYNIDIKPGDSVFEFIERQSPEEGNFWRNVYTEALNGKALRFEKDFSIGDYLSTVAFSVNPIVEGGHIIGLSCFATDTTALTKARREIMQLNEGLEAKVAERTAELAKVNRDLETFSYSVSHDLRTPLRGIMSFTKVIQKTYGAEFNDHLKMLFAYIEESSIRMNTIINDLLALAKYEKKQLNLAPLEMNNLFNKVWTNILLTSPNHAVLQTSNLPVVQADASMIEQVLINLLSNAVKYSSKKDKPLITVGCKEENGTAVFSIKDNGVGFDMKHYTRLFAAFERLHGMDEFEGTGVGLLLVKKIIEKHGGNVWAEGEVDEGAIFYFTLPLAN